MARFHPAFGRSHRVSREVLDALPDLHHRISSDLLTLRGGEGLAHPLPYILSIARGGSFVKRFFQLFLSFFCALDSDCVPLPYTYNYTHLQGEVNTFWENHIISHNLMLVLTNFPVAWYNEKFARAHL